MTCLNHNLYLIYLHDNNQYDVIINFHVMNIILIHPISHGLYIIHLIDLQYRIQDHRGYRQTFFTRKFNELSFKFYNLNK